jgi:hypothetical protein
VGCQKTQCGGTVSVLNATAAHEGTNAPEPGDGDSSNEKLVVNVTMELLCYMQFLSPVFTPSEPRQKIVM